MEQGKIKNFEKDFPGRAFPFLRSLAIKEMEAIRKEFAKKIDLEGISDSLTLVQFLYSKTKKISYLNADNDKFFLSEVFALAAITPNKQIYIDWGRFDKIYLMFYEDLNKYFQYIWYPAADDVSLFDDSFSWILFVSHEGYIDYLKF